nr:alpha/beta hydrolase [Catenuloplanes japonicus]
MAGDGPAVMSALGWDSAHLCSTSMGSGIALATAILHPGRVRTVTATMGGPMRRRDALRFVRFGFFARAARIRHPATGEGAVRTMVDLTRMLATPHAPFDEEWARATAAISHARAPHDPGSTQRQAAAGLSPGPLSARLGEITAPTLLLNGADDPLIRPSAGAALARRVPGARAVILPRMGHLIQQHLWTPLADAVAAQAALRP